MARYFPKSKTAKVLISIVFLLVVVRITLPYFLKRYINYVLYDHITDYTGHIEDFDLALWRGAYQMKGFVLSKVEDKIPVPFMKSKEIDFSIAWKPLIWNHKVVGRVTLDEFQVNFVNGPSAETTQTGTEGKGWVNTIDELFPLDIEELVVHNSEVHFRDLYRKPKVDLYLHHTEFTASNLTNTKDVQKELVSDYKLTADIQKQGTLKTHGGFSLLKKPQSFDINLAAHDMNIVDFNDFFKAYANFDAGKGRIDIFSEVASRSGNIKGYVKPLLTGVSILEPKNKKDDAATGSDILFSLVNLIIRRYSKDQVATKIPFEGTLSDPKVKTWDAVKSMFQHAFGEALKPKIDNDINIAKVPKTKQPQQKESAR